MTSGLRTYHVPVFIYFIFFLKWIESVVNTVKPWCWHFSSCWFGWSLSLCWPAKQLRPFCLGQEKTFSETWPNPTSAFSKNNSKHHSLGEDWCKSHFCLDFTGTAPVFIKQVAAVGWQSVLKTLRWCYWRNGGSQMAKSIHDASSEPEQINSQPHLARSTPA